MALLGNSGSWETPVPVGKYDASLAQLVEHDTLNVGVLGSSPRGSTSHFRWKWLFLWHSLLFLFLFPYRLRMENQNTIDCIPTDAFAKIRFHRNLRIRDAPLPDAQFANTYCSPTPITRYENDSVSCQPKPGDIFTRPANTNRKRGFSTRPSRSVRITRQTHGQLFKEIDTVKTVSITGDTIRKEFIPTVRQKRITRNEALASGYYKAEKRLLFHIRHTEDGEMYAAVGTYLQQGRMPLERPPLGSARISAILRGAAAFRSNTSSTTCSDPSRSYGASENITSNRFDALFR